jgi:uncharacterized protein
MSHNRFILKLIAGLALVCAWASASLAAGPLPPKPDRYFSDRVGIVDATTAETLNHELANFERETSDQLLVAIFQKVPDGFDRDGFTVQTAHAWGVGRHERNNGAVLFVFVDDHYVRIEVGYGLEAVLTDATCATIIRNDIVPAFRRRDYEAGLNAAVGHMMLACRGEFQGTGRTVAEGNGTFSHRNYSRTNSTHAHPDDFSLWEVGGFVALLLFFGLMARRRGRYYGSNYDNTWNSGGGSTWFIGGGNSGSSDSSSSSNDSFSSGGGDFGGGGAGGSW